MYLKKCRKWLMGAGLAVVLAASVMQGCGGDTAGQDEGKRAGETTEQPKEDGKDKKTEKETEAVNEDHKLLEDMKEFTSKDGSISMKLNQAWSEEDLGVDFWLGVQSSRGDEAVLIMQFPKDGTMQLAADMEAVKELTVQSYGVTDSTDTDAPQIPGMKDVTASICKVTTGGETLEGYLIFGETDYAYYSLLYGAEKIGDDEIQSMNASCSTFIETPVEAEDHTTVELSDTVRWFNASYAVLTELNGWDYNRYAGLPANDSTAVLEQQSLDEWWGVTDRASADETLDWILTEGHRTGFAEDMKFLEEQELGQVPAEDRKDFILEILDVTEEEAEGYAASYGMYEEFGEDAIAGWDYCRAMNLLSFYYLAGYYTEEESLDKSLEIAGTIQPLFDSWDDLIASYMRGYEYWAEESSAERQAVYEDLKTREDNPYAVDYHTTLEKTW